jgi:DNA helicase-2/ATP-dependent DNA helicase PcrA
VPSDVEAREARRGREAAEARSGDPEGGHRHPGPAVEEVELERPVHVARELVGVDGLEAFLESVTLVSDQDELPDEGEGAVTLMTLHTAKGLEFRAVFVVGLGAGFLFIRACGRVG